MPFFSPGQKFRGARVSSVVGMVIPSGVNTTFTAFDVVNYDSEGVVNLGLIQGIPIPAGVQLVQYSASISFGTNAVGLRFAQISLSVAGNTSSGARILPVATDVTLVALPTIITRINGVAQNIEIVLFQNSGAGINASVSLVSQFFY